MSPETYKAYAYPVEDGSEVRVLTARDVVTIGLVDDETVPTGHRGGRRQVAHMSPATARHIAGLLLAGADAAEGGTR